MPQHKKGKEGGKCSWMSCVFLMRPLWFASSDSIRAEHPMPARQGVKFRRKRKKMEVRRKEVNNLELWSVMLEVACCFQPLKDVDR